MAVAPSGLSCREQGPAAQAAGINPFLLLLLRDLLPTPPLLASVYVCASLLPWQSQHGPWKQGTRLRSWGVFSWPWGGLRQTETGCVDLENAEGGFVLQDCWSWASLIAQTVKNPPAMQEPQGQFLGQEDPLEKGMAIHSSILTWRIPRTEEPGGL